MAVGDWVCGGRFLLEMVGTGVVRGEQAGLVEVRWGVNVNGCFHTPYDVAGLHPSVSPSYFGVLSRLMETPSTYSSAPVSGCMGAFERRGQPCGYLYPLRTSGSILS